MLIIGCDFHSRFQQIAMLDEQTGETIERRLEHETGEARTFYAALPDSGTRGYGSHWLRALVSNECSQSRGTSCGLVMQRRYARGWFGSRRRTNVMLLTCSVCCLRIGFRESGSLLPPSAIFGNCCGIDSNSSVCAARVKNQLHALAMGQGVCRMKKLWAPAGAKGTGSSRT